MLPQGTEPLILADGTVINPQDGTVIQDDDVPLVEVPNNEMMQRDIVASRKRISDLPLPPDKMNTVSVIMSYTLFGIVDSDIANILSIPVNQIETIKASEIYKDLQGQFVNNIMESDASNVRGMFVQKSNAAAHTMFNLLGSNNEATRGSAAKDILDRAGHRPADVVEHRHSLEGGLTIEYVEKKDKDIPMIDITPQEM